MVDIFEPNDNPQSSDQTSRVTIMFLDRTPIGIGSNPIPVSFR